MADGKVIIDVILDDGTVTKGVANLDRQLGGLHGSGQKAALGIGKIVTALGLVALGSKAINMVTSALDGAISRYDTLNTFPVVMEQIGFSAESSQGAINKLSDGIQGLPTTLDTVASTTQRIATLTNDLDGAVDTTLALNNAFIASGSDSANASRGLEQYVQMLSKGEVDLEAWRTLQETMGVALNDVAKSFGFAGASAQNDLYDALKEGNITFDQFNAKIIELDGGVNGFADRAKTSSGGIRTAFTNMKTAVVRGVTAIIESIDGVLKNTSLKSIENVISNFGNQFNAVLTRVANAIPTVVTWITSVKTALEPWLPLIQAVVIAIGTFVGTFATINTLRNIIMSVRTAVLAMNAALLANPVALVIAIIAGLIAILIVAYNKVDWFRNMVNSAWVWLKTSTSGAFAAIKSVISSVIGAVVTFVKQQLGVIKNFWKQNNTDILNTVKIIFSAIKTYIQMVLGVIKGIFQAVWPALKGIVQIAWAGIRAVISTAINLVLGIIKTVMKIIQGDWKSAWNSIKSTAKTILNNIVSIFKGVDLASIGKDIIKGLIRGISSMAGAVKDAVSKVVSGIKDKIKSALDINSPSRWMRDMIGKNMMLGWEVGIERESKAPRLAMDKATGSLLDSIKNTSANSLLRGVMPSGGALSASNVINNNYSNNYDDAEVKTLLRQIAEKDSNLYVGREKLGEVVDHEQARRTGLFGRRVAFD